MKDNVRDIWKMYHKHPEEWITEVFGPQSSGYLLHDLIPLIPPEPISILSSQVLFSERSPIAVAMRYSSKASRKYMDDTTKCTKSPWVYQTEKRLKDIDVAWFDKAYGSRTKDWNVIHDELYQGALEMSKVEKCYDVNELLGYAKNTFDIDVEEMILSFTNILQDIKS